MGASAKAMIAMSSVGFMPPTQRQSRAKANRKCAGIGRRRLRRGGRRLACRRAVAFRPARNGCADSQIGETSPRISGRRDASPQRQARTPGATISVRCDFRAALKCAFRSKKTFPFAREPSIVRSTQTKFPWFHVREKLWRRWRGAFGGWTGMTANKEKESSCNHEQTKLLHL